MLHYCESIHTRDFESGQWVQVSSFSEYVVSSGRWREIRTQVLGKRCSGGRQCEGDGTGRGWMGTGWGELVEEGQRTGRGGIKDKWRGAGGGGMGGR